MTVPSTATAWILVRWLRAVHGGLRPAVHAASATPLWLVVVFAVAWMTGFLTWAAAGGTVPVVGLLAGSLALAVPLVFGALGGVLGERSGVVNIAIDGQLLFGAFAAAMVGSLTGSTGRAWSAPMVAGLLVALVLGPVRDQLPRRPGDRRRRAQRAGDRITSFMFSQVLAPTPPTLNTPPRFRGCRSRSWATSR